MRRKKYTSTVYCNSSANFLWYQNSGIATIRSNDAIEFFRQKFEAVHDSHTRAFFIFIASSRWLGFRMDAIMFVLLMFSSFLAVLVQDQGTSEPP